MAEERRVVTILFADVVGSTALGDALDPEDLRALLRRCTLASRSSNGSVMYSSSGGLSAFR